MEGLGDPLDAQTLQRLLAPAERIPGFAHPPYPASEISPPDAGVETEPACRVNLRELQAIRQSLQLGAASPPWWTSAADGVGPTGLNWSPDAPEIAIGIAIVAL